MIDYKNQVTFVKVESGEYRNEKTMTEQQNVNCLLIKSDSFAQAGFREGKDADAILYVDPSNQFIQDNIASLEGLYVLSTVFGTEWYRVGSYSVHKDHLLENEIDNIELVLKRTRAIVGVS